MSQHGHRDPDPSAPTAEPERAQDETGLLAAEAAIDPGAVRRWTRGDTVRVVIASLVLLACWLFASVGVPSAEITAFDAVNNGPGWLNPVVWPVMQLGNVAVAVGLAILIGIAVSKPRIGFLVALAAAAAWMVAKVVKEQVRRGRPGSEGLDVVLRGPMEDGFGFISGHSTVAFAVAAVAAPHLRRPWNWVALGAAVTVGLARIYVGVHLPLDVIGGAACGLLIGEAVRLVEVRTRTWPFARRDARAGRAGSDPA